MGQCGQALQVVAGFHILPIVVLPCVLAVVAFE